MSDNSTIKQRILDFKAFCVRNGIRYKEVCERAGIDYTSVVNNFSSTLRGSISFISADRMDLLEETALEIEKELNPEKVAQ